MWRRFFLSTAGIFLLLCALTAAFNFSVDPYNIYQPPKTIGFNFYSDVVQHHERLFKAIELIRRRPDIVVLGNSKSDFAINPDLFGANAFNASLRNAQPKELLAFARAARRVNPHLKRLIIAVDFEMFAFNQEYMTGFDPDQLNADHITIKNIFNTLLTVDALDDSISTVKFNRLYQRDFQPFETNGKFSEPALYEIFTFENAFTHNSNQMSRWAPIDPDIYNRKFDEFQEIVELCREGGIELTVLILPVSRYHFERYPSTEYKLWQKKLADITPVKDFASIFINDSTIDNEENFWDAAHIKARAFEHYICAMFQ